jgi:GTP-binding protein
MTKLFTNAKYLLSTLDDIPPFLDAHKRTLPEIALVGRSNVGKSSLINHLLNRKNLAKVSAQPGKTQTINYFNVDDKLILVDLPGYGYAKRPQEMQLKWSAAIDHYLEKRSSLALLILLIDSRRVPTDEDLAIAQWARHRKKPLLLILTKSDTLDERERKLNVEKVLEILHVPDFLHYSIKEAKSRNQLITKIDGIIK